MHRGQEIHEFLEQGIIISTIVLIPLTLITHYSRFSFIFQSRGDGYNGYRFGFADCTASWRLHTFIDADKPSEDILPLLSQHGTPWRFRKFILNFRCRHPAEQDIFLCWRQFFGFERSVFQFDALRYIRNICGLEDVVFAPIVVLIIVPCLWVFCISQVEQEWMQQVQGKLALSRPAVADAYSSTECDLLHASFMQFR